MNECDEPAVALYSERLDRVQISRKFKEFKEMPAEEEMKIMRGEMDDLELKDIGNFTGTEQYHRLGFFKTLASDGISYIIQNGYAWFVTDAVAVIENSEDKRIRHADFLAIKLKLNGNKAKVQITNRGGKVHYERDYKYTDAKRELVLFYENGVILLAGEH